MLDVYLYIMTVNNNSRVLLVFTSFLGFRSTVHIFILVRSLECGRGCGSDTFRRASVNIFPVHTVPVRLQNT